MTGDTMKSGVVESDRVKVEGRQSIHRRRMSKNAPIVNGAEESLGYAAEEESMVRQVNLAAAFHDHISCTKSAELCKPQDSKEGRANLPCETDHIYANCSETKSKGHIMVATTPSAVKDNSQEIQRLQEMILLQLDLIQHQQEQLLKKERQLQSLKQEREALKVRLERMERRMCLLKKKDTKSDDESADNMSDVGSALSDSLVPTSAVQSSTEKAYSPPVHLVTRYFGRRSRTIPLRALKRRYFGPPKSFPSKKSAITSSSSTASLSSASETQDEEKTVETETVNMVKIPPSPSEQSVTNFKKSHKKQRGRRPHLPTRKDDFLQTDRPYFLPVSCIPPHSPVSNQTIDGKFDVPSWRYRPVTSFYQMEGTENIDEKVFYRRHLKYEQDEKRRKRWDIQRLREQKITEKYKRYQSLANGTGGQSRRKSESFYPNPNNIEFIEVTETLPVLAFGHLIPLFQPSEFSLPWFVAENRENMELSGKAKKNRTAISGHKVT